MTEQDKATIRLEVVNCMYLVATRNRLEFEKKSQSFIQSLENETDEELTGLSLFTKGISAFFHNNYEEAKVLLKKIVDLEIKKNDLKGAAHMGLGLTYRSTGDLDDSVTHLTSAIELIDKKGIFREFLAYCYQSLGDIHTNINEYEIAINYFKQALAASRQDDQNISQFRYHMGLGGCYLKMKDYEKSRFHLTKSLEVNDLPPTIISRIENDLGVLHFEMKEYKEAERLLKSSLVIREGNKLEDAACTTMTVLAEVYLEQKKISEVFEMIDRCQVLVDKYQTKGKKLKLLNLMARIHSQTGNYETAIECYEKYIALYDEIKSEQERNIFKFKNEQIEKQRKIISDKHNQLVATFEEIKRLKVNRKAVIFSWITIIILVIISELLIDPLIENYAYNNLLSLLVKILIALLFKPLDGLYEKILWERTMRKAS